MSEEREDGGDEADDAFDDGSYADRRPGGFVGSRSLLKIVGTIVALLLGVVPWPNAWPSASGPHFGAATLLGAQHVAPPPVATPAPALADTVWANEKSRVYHCPGTRYFGATKRGVYLSEAIALERGYRAAGGKRCRALSNLAPETSPDTAARSVVGRALTVEQVHRVPRCGTDRWPVKTLTDRDRTRVDTVAVRSTVKELGSIPIPNIPYPRDRRIAPLEVTTYRVTAVIAQISVQDDGDWHLVLRDVEDARYTMIAEIPLPECAVGSGYEERFRSVRQALRGIRKGARVEVTGVGFFDFLHNQRGGAGNGVELHPVLGISAVSEVR